MFLQFHLFELFIEIVILKISSILELCTLKCSIWTDRPKAKISQKPHNNPHIAENKTRDTKNVQRLVTLNNTNIYWEIFNIGCVQVGHLYKGIMEHFKSFKPKDEFIAYVLAFE